MSIDKHRRDDDGWNHGSGGSVGWPTDVLAEPNPMLSNGDLDESLAIEHELHDRLCLEDDPAIHRHVASLGLLHQHPYHTVTPLSAPMHANHQTCNAYTDTTNAMHGQSTKYAVPTL